jgi:hypothetical protein
MNIETTKNYDQEILDYATNKTRAIQKNYDQEILHYVTNKTRAIQNKIIPVT